MEEERRRQADPRTTVEARRFSYGGPGTSSWQYPGGGQHPLPVGGGPSVPHPHQQGHAALPPSLSTYGTRPP
eukprot:gene26829-55385_t